MTAAASRDTVAPGLAARQGAVRLISAVLDRKRIPDDGPMHLPAAERAQARTLADTVFRRLGTLDTVLSELVERAPRPPVIHVLRLMAAELLLTGTAPHAAVDLAVRQLKAGSAPRMAGLANAVGRRLAREGKARLAMIVESQRGRPDDMPAWLWDRLSADWGAGTARAIARAHLAHPPLDIALRTPADGPALADALGGTPLPTGGLRLEDRGQISAMPGFAEGAWWVQDAAAQEPVRLLGDVAGLRLLDLCAAPGGKTLQLAAAGASVTAVDISERRTVRLRENLARTGLSAETVVVDSLEWEPERTFDAILLDAPCSATGTVRRNPDLPHRTDGSEIAALTDLQSRLLERAWSWLAPGGRLIYATCSLLRAEGEDQIARFLESRPDARPGPTLRTLPSDWQETGGRDGFFAARLDRSV